jgi:DNA-binding XRE family transcriptional regulator
MVSATLEGNHLVVLFEDGAKVSIEVHRLLASRTQDMLWGEVHTSPYELILPTPDGKREIPWITIRLLTDSEFAAYNAQVAEEQAREIGQRLKEIRRNKGLSSKEVAERAGVTAQSLSRIENGHHDVVFTTLSRILAAMGATLADLAEVDETPVLTVNH